MGKIISQSLMGDLYDHLAELMKEKSDRSLINREVARLVQHYGDENVKFVLKVIQEDMEIAK